MPRASICAERARIAAPLLVNLSMRSLPATALLLSVLYSSPGVTAKAPPELPAGLDKTGASAPSEQTADKPDRHAEPALPVTGFLDLRSGVRLRDDARQRPATLAETRLQLAVEHSLGSALLRATADLLYDRLADTQRVDLESGRGWLDLREAFVSAPLGNHADLRIGRQILTWGVGDLLFLNDLFPKDWNAFFVGRDVDYLKAPSDAVRLGLYSSWVNLDVIHTPRFDADRFLDPQRLSFFSPNRGGLIGRGESFSPIQPDRWWRDSEFALRLHRLLGGWEVAAYGYRGYWKSPTGFDEPSQRPLFPRLSVWGASARGVLGGGVLSAETAWYRSRDDLSGRDPNVPNSQFRLLLGYERELFANLTVGVQYYLEHTLRYGRLRQHHPPQLNRPDHNRHLLTLRTTWLTHAQNVTWSLFTFASPGESDLYLRAGWSWKASDRWAISAGINWFEGRRNTTFFGQLQSNSNVHIGLRYSFRVGSG